MNMSKDTLKNTSKILMLSGAFLISLSIISILFN